MGMMIPTRESEQQNPMEHAKSLMARKDQIESEIATQGEILKSNNSDLTSPLVDAEGFPRDDVDVWAVRHARVRIIELRNDLKDIIGEIAIALQTIYPPSTSKESESHTPPPNPPAPQLPFAKVDGIHPGSPAATAVCMHSLARIMLLKCVCVGIIERRFGCLIRTLDEGILQSCFSATSCRVSFQKGKRKPLTSVLQ